MKVQMPLQGKSINKPPKTAEDKINRLKMITAFVVLTLIVGSFGIAVLTYTLSTLKEPASDTAASGYASETETEEFIRRLKESAPEFQTERVSYDAYRINTGKNAGEAIINIDADEQGFYVTVQYNCENVLLDIPNYENTVIWDYLNEKQQETIDNMLSDISDSFAYIADAMSKVHVRDAEKYEFRNCFYDVMKNGGNQYLTAAGLDIGIEDSGEDAKTINVKLCKYYEE